MTETDAIVEQMLTTCDTITVVCASSAPAKAAHPVALSMQRRGARNIPVIPTPGRSSANPSTGVVADVS